MLSFDYIVERIETKKADYIKYGFSQEEDDAFKTFFDLAQELDSIKEFYVLCVAIPKCFMNLDASLYLVNPRDRRFMLVTSSTDTGSPEAPDVPVGSQGRSERNSLVFKIRGKSILIDQLPFEPIDDVLGLIEVFPADNINAHTQLFLEKYANRIGFNLHNRMLVEKNIEHLRFIRTLVADIEHNIIAPNIIYKLYIKNLNAAINKSAKVARALADYTRQEDCSPAQLTELAAEFAETNRTMSAELEEINKHHRNMSLFLETLLRRSHFDQGRLTLMKKKCNMKKEIVEPQLERYLDRFINMGIAVDVKKSGIPDAEVISVVDKGLMAQVYANLFSNALKYTEEIHTHEGPAKYLSYGHEVVSEFFGPGIDGIKFNVFTTGRHIAMEERERIFEDQYRGSNIESQPGSGHGLSFIKNVVEIHGGVVGYEPTQFGNNFYFILPRALKNSKP